MTKSILATKTLKEIKPIDFAFSLNYFYCLYHTKTIKLNQYSFNLLLSIYCIYDNNESFNQATKLKLLAYFNDFIYSIGLYPYFWKYYWTYNKQHELICVYEFSDANYQSMFNINFDVTKYIKTWFLILKDNLQWINLIQDIIKTSCYTHTKNKGFEDVIVQFLLTKNPTTFLTWKQYQLKEQINE